MIAVYRLYTEQRDNLPELVCRYFSGATLLPAMGVWQRDTEKATVIEVIATTSHTDASRIEQLASDIVDTNAQQLVIILTQSARMLTRTDVSAYGVAHVA